MKREAKNQIPGDPVRQPIPQDAYKGKPPEWKSGTPVPFRPQFNFGNVKKTS